MLAFAVKELKFPPDLDQFSKFVEPGNMLGFGWRTFTPNLKLFVLFDDVVHLCRVCSENCIGHCTMEQFDWTCNMRGLPWQCQGQRTACR